MKRVLIAKGYTHPNLLAAKGESAGSVMIAHVINQKPELFRAAILKSPFLDVVNTLEDKTPQFLSSEYQEFGNPFDSDEYYKAINSYNWSHKSYKRDYSRIGRYRESRFDI